MIVRMLHLPLDMNKLHNEKSAQSAKEHMTEYKIDKEVSVTSWIISTRTPIFIPVSNNMIPRGIRESYFMASIPGGLV